MSTPNSNPADLLPAQGFRFIRRNGAFSWVHPLEVGAAPDLLDCTDMDDAEFERVVCETEAA
jgi:hypothetical protein